MYQILYGCSFPLYANGLELGYSCKLQWFSMKCSCGMSFCHVLGKLTGWALTYLTYSTYPTTLIALGKSFIMLFKLRLPGSQVYDMDMPLVATGAYPL